MNYFQKQTNLTFQMSLRHLSVAVVILLLCQANALHAQETSYTDGRGNVHLCGPLQLSDLTSDTTYSQWYQASYSDFELEEGKKAWKKNLKDVDVEIYFGTWCGDSKKYVPKFIRLWEELGMDVSQLDLVALYGTRDQYKQGPSGEEKGKDIHRVPTFIFKKDGQEFARIVEHPSTSLETDLAQIAYGYPPAPNYAAATYMQRLLSEKTKEEIDADFRTYLRKAYGLVSKRSELNTLGYVYLRSGQIEEALTCFYFNTYFYRYDPNVYDSYADGLLASGDTTNAILNYEKVLEIEPEDKNAMEQLALLRPEDK